MLSLVMVAAVATGCVAQTAATTRQTFGGHIDPSIALERNRAFDAQPWAFALDTRTFAASSALFALLALEGHSAAEAIAAADRIPAPMRVAERVTAAVLDRLDARK
ncbi:MAG: hypothetical protein KF773_38220 [Deltaproteobacteria bacterium]|nr:hypothetical protein [Deltaproteobacteria bacterium]